MAEAKGAQEEGSLSRMKYSRSPDQNCAELRSALAGHPAVLCFAIVPPTCAIEAYSVYVISRNGQEHELSQLINSVPALHGTGAVAAPRLVSLRPTVDIRMWAKAVFSQASPREVIAADSLDAARRQVEHITAGVVAKVLKTAHVSGSDNIMDLGGQSLELQKAAASLEEIFSVPVPVRELFQCSSIADLAHGMLKPKQFERVSLRARMLTEMVRHSELSRDVAS